MALISHLSLFLLSPLCIKQSWSILKCFNAVLDADLKKKERDVQEKSSNTHPGVDMIFLRNKVYKTFPGRFQTTFIPYISGSMQ